MKLAFCLFNYFPYGGLQRDCMRIAKECIKRGHSVDVFTMRWEGEKDPDLSLFILTSSAWQNHSRIKEFIRQFQPIKTQYDLVIGFNKMPGLDVYYAADMCYQAKTRQKHGFLYRLLPRYRQLLHYEKTVFSKDSHTKIFMISPLQQPEFIRYYQTPSDRFHFLPPGIDKDRIAPDNAAEIRLTTRRKLGLNENENLLLMIGSGFKTKGLARILEGFASLSSELKKSSQLFIIGKDNSVNFKKQASLLNIADSVHFLGGRDDIPEFLLAADLLLHPAYFENTGTVLLEALASGLPVLTTDRCGYAHYVAEAKAGKILQSPYQQKEFNQTLQTMLKSPERSTWRNNALNFSKKADIYNMPEHAVDLIESFK